MQADRHADYGHNHGGYILFACVGIQVKIVYGKGNSPLVVEDEFNVPIALSAFRDKDSPLFLTRGLSFILSLPQDVYAGAFLELVRKEAGIF